MQFMSKIGQYFRKPGLFYQLQKNLTAPFILALFAVMGTPAHAVPSYAEQTKQPCSACHVGGFGPQLTQFGRAFKLSGYTMRSGASIPISSMAVASFFHTSKDQPGLAPQSKPNDNVSLDQVSLFLAGGIGNHFGGFVQGTYDGISKSFAWDNLDLRATTNATIGKANVLLGLNINNSPTLQDVWNTQPAFGFPYTGSALAPGPSAATQLDGAFAQNVLGVSTYAWINSSIYAEIGGYKSLGSGFLKDVGVDPIGLTNIKGTAPYARLAYEKDWGTHNLQLGAFGFFPRVYPGRDRSTGMTDNISDLGLDASYQMFRANGDVITINSRFIREKQQLHASQLLGLSANSTNSLKDFRIDGSYYWRNRVGGTIGIFNTWGTKDALLYGNSLLSSPNSSGATFQIDWTPWGDGNSPVGLRGGLRVGAQYSKYFRVDGSSKNFDGAGTNASDYDALRVFLWTAY